MATKQRLFVAGEIPFDVVQTVFNELLTADHDTRSVAVSMAGAITGYENYYPSFALGKGQVAQTADIVPCPPSIAAAVSVNLRAKPTRARPNPLFRPRQAENQNVAPLSQNARLPSK